MKTVMQATVVLSTLISLAAGSARADVFLTPGTSITRGGERIFCGQADSAPRLHRFTCSCVRYDNYNGDTYASAEVVAGNQSSAEMKAPTACKMVLGPKGEPNRGMNGACVQDD